MNDIANPFDALLRMLIIIDQRLQDLNAKVSAERPAWEPIGKAQKTRGKGRKTLLAAVNAGLIPCRRVRTKGGQEQYFLGTAELDQHFPNK